MKSIKTRHGKIVFGICLSVFLFCGSLLALYGCCKRHQDPIYEDANSLKELYLSHADDFQNIADIALAGEAYFVDEYGFYERIILDISDEDYTGRMSNYFTKEQLQSMEAFIEPGNSLIRCDSPTTVILGFATKKDWAYLLYIAPCDEELLTRIENSYRRSDYKLLPIENNWYIWYIGPRD